MRFIAHLSIWALAQGGAGQGPPPGLNEPSPIEAADTVFTEEMTWMEVRDAIAAGKTTVIVGTGGLEQNGPHVATGKHNYVLRSTTEAIARKLGNALVAPIVPFVPEGRIDPPSGHMWYPGTISLEPATFQALLTDICSSLKQHGFRDIVLIGDSGGNLDGMEATAKALNARWAGGPARVYHIREYYEQDIWSYDELKRMGIVQQPDVKSASRAGVHTDFHYESIVALVDPALIHAEQRMKAGSFEVYGVPLAPLEKTLEAARHLVDYRADIAVAAIRKAMAEASRH
jgi:creatinine amidohydrolase/Fe(II)-dependent formamide hydrolase-like protein